MADSYNVVIVGSGPAGMFAGREMTDLGIESILVMPPDVIFTLDDPSAADVALSGLTGSVRLADERTAHWRPPPKYLEMPTLLTILVRNLQAASERV